ncbi:restriction endonuclease [Vagococcus fluvialis]|uniref:MvaI/BcnI family restriction endonuclease n=1 Tax=Vagococcus fluvialis TaxID=2738 RepID=UPI001432FDF9|nr:MvaI/BcnI family restriction endonuclease [Vagococcus fluvialis]NKC60590.1 restriction endonuclease [Vagococcus fluvialis]NKD51426.1 restriction endonuclease [Vagococcus fluvialis]
MLYIPYSDELDKINIIHKFNEQDYVLIRVTETMVEKNIIDTNALLQDLLRKYQIVDYINISNGGRNGYRISTLFLSDLVIKNLNINFYRVNNRRSDPRFSIELIKKQVEDSFINIGDLLYISVFYDNGCPQLVIINISTPIIDEEQLYAIFGISPVEDSLSRLIPQIKSIAQQGYHPNSAGTGRIAPKDVGDTLEYLLGIDVNNLPTADFEGLIEIKAKTGKTLDTLFTLRPQFDYTRVGEYEPNDRSRVSAFARLYGYESESHPGMKTLYVTIGNQTAPQNNQNLFLRINEEKRIVELRHRVSATQSEVAAYWIFEDLERELHRKHPATLWVKAHSRYNNQGIGEFRYHYAELSRTPQFTTFLSLIELGVITYDWRGYTTPEGKYSGKNHGNAWRIRKNYRDQLFGSLEKIDLY